MSNLQFADGTEDEFSRVLTDDELAQLPETELPDEPSEEQVKDLKEKKEKEDLHGHPAFHAQVEYD